MPSIQPSSGSNLAKTPDGPFPADSPPPPVTGPQLVALQALLSGHTIASAARGLQISERTLRAWCRLPAFRARLEEGQAQFLRETNLLLAIAAGEAVRALVQVCQDPLAAPAARVAAAGKILDLLYRRAPSAGAAPPLVAEAPGMDLDQPAPESQSDSPFVFSDDVQYLEPRPHGAGRGLVEPSAGPRPEAQLAPKTGGTRQDSAESGSDRLGIASPADLEGPPPLLSGHPYGPPPDLTLPLLALAPPLVGPPTRPEDPLPASTPGHSTPGNRPTTRRGAPPQKAGAAGRCRSR